MNKKAATQFVLSALSAAACFSASAATITLDDFTMFQQVVTSGGTGTGTVNNGTNFDSRTITITTENSLGVNPNAIVTTGRKASGNRFPRSSRRRPGLLLPERNQNKQPQSSNSRNRCPF